MSVEFYFSDGEWHPGEPPIIPEEIPSPSVEFTIHPFTSETQPLYRPSFTLPEESTESPKRGYNSRPIGGPIVCDGKLRKEWFLNGARGFITRNHGNDGYTVKFYEPFGDPPIEEYVVHTTEIKADRNATEEDLDYIRGYMRWWHRRELLEQ